MANRKVEKLRGGHGLRAGADWNGMLPKPSWRSSSADLEGILCL